MMRALHLLLFGLLSACPSPTAPSDTDTDTDTDPDATPVLPGDPSEDAWGALPEIPLPETDAAQVVHDGPASFVRDQLLVMLARDATVGDVNALAADLGAEIVGCVPRVGLLLLQARTPTADLAWVGQAVGIADASPAVAVATPSVILYASSLPPAGDQVDGWRWDTTTGPTWGLQFIHAPQAWSLYPLLEPNKKRLPQLLVLDTGFFKHPDVFFDDAPLQPVTDGELHGTAVAGVMAASWGNEGVEGVLPNDDTLIWTLRGQSSTFYDYGQALEDAANAMQIASDADVPLVINQSQGIHFHGTSETSPNVWVKQFQVGPADPSKVAGLSNEELTQRMGITYRLFAELVPATFGGWDDWLWVCAAGNHNVNAAVRDRWAARGVDMELFAMEAAHGSGCSWAATTDGGTGHFLTVESLDVGGARLNDTSARKGNLAAPGTDVGLPYAKEVEGVWTPDYRTQSGSSFASPMVAGAAALLWAVHPEARFTEVRDALLTGARGPVEGSAPRLDLWGALHQLERHGGPDVDLFMADVDDGTVDGSTRRALDGTVPAVVPIKERGDGCVDMRDFRAFRDALLDASQTRGHGVFDDAADLHRDQNDDGRLLLETGNVERLFSRFDLDGNGAVEAVDLDVMRAQWGRCQAGKGPPNTEGVGPDQLPGLLSSADVWLPLGGAFDDAWLTIDGRTRRFVLGNDLQRATAGGRTVVTAPAAACDLALQVRHRSLGSASDRTFTTDEGIGIGADLLAAPLSAAVDTTVPLAHRHLGPTYDESVVYEPGGTTLAMDGVRLQGMMAPAYTTGGQRHWRFAAPWYGNRVWIVTDGALDWWYTSAVSDEFYPLQWSDDAQGLLLVHTGASQDRLFWAQIDDGWLREVAPGIDKAFDDAPSVAAGFVWFRGVDGKVFRVATDPPEDAPFEEWIDALTEPTCGLSPLLDDAELVLDLSARPGARLARAHPAPVDRRGDRVLYVVPTGGGAFDLHVATTDGVQDVVLRSDWKPRGGQSTFVLPEADGVAWHPDGDAVLYADTDGVWLAELGLGDLPDPAAIKRTKLYGKPGAAAFDPTGAHLVVLERCSRTDADCLCESAYPGCLDTVAPGVEPIVKVSWLGSDGSPVDSYRHAWGAGPVALSASGAQLAVVVEAEDNTDVAVYAPPSFRDVDDLPIPRWTTAAWTDTCGVGCVTNTREDQLTWAVDLWPW